MNSWTGKRTEKRTSRFRVLLFYDNALCAYNIICTCQRTTTGKCLPKIFSAGVHLFTLKMHQRRIGFTVDSSIFKKFLIQCSFHIQIRIQRPRRVFGNTRIKKCSSYDVITYDCIIRQH